MQGELPASLARHASTAIVDADRAGERERRDPQGVAADARSVRAEAARAARRLGRSHGLEQHAAQDSKPLTGDDPTGNYLHYGVREFGMAAMMNGLALHGGVIPYGGTFLVFSDYARNALAHGGADEACAVSSC